MYTSLDTQGRLSARLLSAQARSACLFFLLLLLFYSQGAYAHGVAEGDKGYIQEITGVNIIPFIYLGAKHMVTGYDHLLFLFGVIFFLYKMRDIGLYVSLFATWPVTSRMSTQQTVLMPQPGQDIYSTNQMSWPQREKTMAFNQALNNWLEVIRANRDDWCTIIHSDIEATRLSLKTCLGQLS